MSARLTLLSDRQTFHVSALIRSLTDISGRAILTAAHRGLRQTPRNEFVGFSRDGTPGARNTLEPVVIRVLKWLQSLSSETKRRHPEVREVFVVFSNPLIPHSRYLRLPKSR